jgi:hypothetical protein
MQYFKKILSKIYIYIQPIGRLVGKVISPLSLLFVYFIIVLPTGLMLKLFNKDVLDLKFSKKKNTYWIKREQESKFEEQF